MRVIRWAAAVATILISLMNLPIAVDDGGSNLPPVLAWLISLLGVLGIVSAVGLIRRVVWGRPAVLAVGGINLIGAVVAMITGMDGAIIGLIISSLVVVLSLLTPAAVRRDVEATSSSVMNHE
jgi:hypothetical protein